MGAPQQVDGCRFHTEVAGNQARHQKWIEEMQATLIHHCSNEDGEGHVTRAEFGALSMSVKEIRGWIMRGAVAVLVAAATGSALGPAVLKVIPLVFGGK